MPPHHYAAVAADAFGWIAAQAVEVPGGYAWTEYGLPCDDLYSGTAGVLMACVEASRYAVDCDEAAGKAVDRLVHLADTRTASVDGGLFGGAAGLLLALRAWADVADDARAAAAADLLVQAVCGHEFADDPARPYDVISGDAGTLIALLPENPALVRDAVLALVERLTGAAQRGEVGLQWIMAPGEDRLMPGFSHGTAGVAYALLLAGRAYVRPDLVELASEAGRSLIALAGEPWALPNRLPPPSLPPPVSFGWCHGPAGTAALFALLDEISPDRAWQQAISACLQALRDSGLPQRLYPGFWDNVGRCCGTAGVGTLLLDRYLATGERTLLDWSAQLADDVLSYAITDEDGTRWSNFEHTATPPDLPPEAGLMQGAAGIAAWLARLGRLQVDPYN